MNPRRPPLMPLLRSAKNKTWMRVWYFVRVYDDDYETDDADVQMAFVTDEGKRVPEDVRDEIISQWHGPGGEPIPLPYMRAVSHYVVIVPHGARALLVGNGSAYVRILPVPKNPNKRVRWEQERAVEVEDITTDAPLEDEED